MEASLLAIVSIAFRLFQLLILGRILLSWLQLDPYNPIVQFIYNATEPILAPIKKVIPPAGMFDLSPIVAIVGAIIVQMLLSQIIRAMF
jgi:YggT family protein